MAALVIDRRKVHRCLLGGIHRSSSTLHELVVLALTTWHGRLSAKRSGLAVAVGALSAEALLTAAEALLAAAVALLTAAIALLAAAVALLGTIALLAAAIALLATVSLLASLGTVSLLATLGTVSLLTSIPLLGTLCTITTATLLAVVVSSRSRGSRSWDSPRRLTRGLIPVVRLARRRVDG